MVCVGVFYLGSDGTTMVKATIYVAFNGWYKINLEHFLTQDECVDGVFLGWMKMVRFGSL